MNTLKSAPLTLRVVGDGSGDSDDGAANLVMRNYATTLLNNFTINQLDDQGDPSLVQFLISVNAGPYVTAVLNQTYYFISQLKLKIIAQPGLYDFTEFKFDGIMAQTVPVAATFNSVGQVVNAGVNEPPNNVCRYNVSTGASDYIFSAIAQPDPGAAYNDTVTQNLTAAADPDTLGLALEFIPGADFGAEELGNQSAEMILNF